MTIPRSQCSLYHARMTVGHVGSETREKLNVCSTQFSLSVWPRRDRVKTWEGRSRENKQLLIGNPYARADTACTGRPKTLSVSLDLAIKCKPPLSASQNGRLILSRRYMYFCLRCAQDKIIRGTNVKN